MKTRFIPVISIISFALILGFSNCKDTTCSTSIDSVLPNANPVDYEVLIKTSGISNTAKVVFGTVAAVSRPGGAAGEIIARVPAGLSGNVEISVEEGDCIARWAGFSVLGSLPGNIQPSLPDIIIPTPPVGLPTGGIENNWANAVSLANNRNFGIHLVGFLAGGITQLDNSYEYHSNNTSPLSNNPVSGTINTNTNVVYLEIDRTAQPGGTVEKFDGQFIGVPSVLFNEKWPILLVSRETGRQLIISFPE